jgi:hypothetical protein
MTSAIPGGALGYDDDKQFGNFITHVSPGILKGCANHSGQTPKVKARRQEARNSKLSGLFCLGRERI